MSEKHLVKQPSAMPTRKVRFGAYGTAAVAVAMGILNAISPDLYQSLMHPGFEAGLALLVGGAMAYFARDESVE